MVDKLGDWARTAFFVASMGEPARDAAMALLRDLRRAGVEAHMEYEGRSIKSQMKRADRLKAAYTLILGEDELARGVVTVKDMRAGEQSQVGRDAILEYCRARRSGGQE